MEEFIRACGLYASDMITYKSMDDIKNDFNEDIKLSEIKEYAITFDGNKVQEGNNLTFKNKSHNFNRLISVYITYYNEQRIKEKLGWMSPVEYRLNLLAA